MGSGDHVMGLVVDVLRGMARAEGAMARVDALLEVVGEAVGAELALLLLVDSCSGVVRVVGPRLPEGIDAALGREMELTGQGDPLLAPVGHGDLSARTASRAFGARAWETSSRRAACLRVCGVDQVATLPVAGGDDIAVAMFGRRGADFTEGDLRRLDAIRPVAADLVMLAGITAPRGQEERPHLTVRETEVLALLARGYTCSRIARTVGASPRTVEVHLGRVYAKLGVRDRLSAVLAAYDLALIPPRDSRETTAAG